MKESQEEYRKIFIIDISKIDDNTKVNLTGYVMERKDYNNSNYGIKVRDITGTIWCNTDKKEIYNSIKQDNRINILGTITTNSKSRKVITIEQINILDVSETTFSLLEEELREQSAKMLMSRILKKISKLLKDNDYIEFDSKLLSRHLPEDESFEPLLVKYPGFGMPICLTISPSAQVIEFLQTTLSKCFTVSTSFCQSHRFPNASHELKVIMAKSLNLLETEHEALLKNLSEQIYKDITGKNEITEKEFTNSWDSIAETIDTNLYFLKESDNDINFVIFNADIPVIGKNWNTTVKKIYYIIDSKGNILMEGAREYVTQDSTICTITLYPSQFLNLIQNAPIRQLTNLDKLFNGNRNQ